MISFSSSFFLLLFLNELYENRELFLKYILMYTLMLSFSMYIQLGGQPGNFGIIIVGEIFFLNEARNVILYSKCSSFKSKIGMQQFWFDHLTLNPSKWNKGENAYPVVPYPLSWVDFGQLSLIWRVYSCMISWIFLHSYLTFERRMKIYSFILKI